MRRRESIACFVFASACWGDPSGPRLVGAGDAILFIGNSYTYQNDIPGILQALADSAGGPPIAVETVAYPDFALIDHWYGGDARSEIGKGDWEFVVLQQGWTPAGVCRDTLRLATQFFDAAIEHVGARTALFEAWAPEALPDQFQGSIESYRIAAEDVGGLLLPIAEAWLAVRNRNPGIALYSDGLHANGTGAYLTALVMYARVRGRSPVGLPARLRTRAGALVNIPGDVASTLQEVAADIGLTPTTHVDPTAPPVLTSRC